MWSSRRTSSQRRAMKAAIAIRRDINPAGLLSGRYLRNEKSERASRGKRITSRGIDNTEEIMAEMAIHITKYAIFLLLSSLLDRNEEAKKKEKTKQNKEFINCCSKFRPDKVKASCCFGIKGQVK